MTATFGLQGWSKLGGQSHRGVSHREDCQNRTAHAGSSRWDSGRTSHRKCRKSDGTDKCWGRSRRHWKGQRPRDAWPSIEPGGVIFGILEKWRKKFYVPCAHRAHLPLSPQEPACHVELLRVPEQGSIEPVSVELWRQYLRRR